MKQEEHLALEKAIDEITEIAKGFGLDFYPMRYEICPADIIYTFGAYGMPTRFSHWSFGKQFFKMKLHYDLGLSKIYELVINSDPCYAFLLDSNSLVQNKLIVAHVLAHCDFFKNNVRFQNTKRDMVESMAATAERIRQYEIEHGKKKWNRSSMRFWRLKNISILHWYDRIWPGHWMTSNMKKRNRPKHHHTTIFGILINRKK